MKYINDELDKIVKWVISIVKDKASILTGNIKKSILKNNYNYERDETT